MSCPEQAKVDLHFAQRISVGEERAMRDHLPGCAVCRGRYERHLLLERLDPTSAGPGPRLASGLGFGERTARVFAFGSPSMRVIGALAVAACIALLLVRSPRPNAEVDGFTARGGAPADGTEVTVYRGTRSSDAPAVRAGSSIRRQDELSFAYANPRGKAFLMIFGVDEQHRVYWYYPAWTDPAAAPTSLAIERTTSPRALPDAVRHDLTGAALDVRAVFTDAPLDVRTVEGLVGKGEERGRFVEGRQAGAIEQSIRFRVEP
jgi:hypothetical protein